jgi:primosomal protein N' (replication factor Y)
MVGAIAIRLCDSPPADLDANAIKPIDDVVSRGFFPSQYWTLLQSIADYYCTPLIQVIRGALPPGLLGRSKRRVRLVPDAIPTGAHEFLHPATRQMLERIEAKPASPYTWAYLQRQGRYARQALQELCKRGWVESYLDTPTAVKPKERLAVTVVSSVVETSLSQRQQDVLDVLRRQGGDMWLQELLQLSRVSSSVVYALEKKGLVVVEPREMLRRDSSGSHSSDRPKSLTPAQASAVDTLKSLSGAHRVLLHGVTGSGKTEVYLQAIAPVIHRGQSVLVLVPEIGLTPQLTDRFRSRFGPTVQVYHSGLSAGERYDTWRHMLLGTPQIVIGTRSAVFAPLANLGLIILDEEHDTSFKQDQPAPCYHARTVAEWRATLEHCPLVLGSATPSLESWQDVRHPNPPADALQSPESSQHRSPDASPVALQRPVLPSHYLSLPDRIHRRPMPPIQVVDMRTEFREGNRSIFSGALQSALEHLQRRQERGILFMHRRGHSTFVSCRSCGEALTCPHCDVSLTYHHTHEHATPSVRCHYCGYGRSQPSTCPACDSPYLKHFGSGTQRIIQELNRQFPALRCLRYDRDTTRTKGAHRALMTRFAQGDADLLIGTQMIAKGIDIPQVTLVGIVSADGLLNLPDFRAAERAYQTLTQVAGRAGRGEEPGRVILQTYTPEHPVIQAVHHQNFDAFLQQELGDRHALHYPPYCQLILIRLSSPDPTAVQQAAAQLGDRLRPEPSDNAPYQILGPAPAAVMKVSRRYRWQLLLKCQPGQAGRMMKQLNLEQVRSLIPRTVSMTIDVDPMTMM